MTLFYGGAFVHILFGCSINGCVVYKNKFKKVFFIILYLFVKVHNVIDCVVFVDIFILKSPIIIIGQCKRIF
jgi:hypothetical protein